MAEPRRIKRLEQHILRTLGPDDRARPRRPPARPGHGHAGEAEPRPLGGAHQLVDASAATPTAPARSTPSTTRAATCRPRSPTRMRTRTTPHLEFHYDPSMENAARIHEILGKLENDRCARDPEDEEAADGTESSGDAEPEDGPVSPDE